MQYVVRMFENYFEIDTVAVVSADNIESAWSIAEDEAKDWIIHAKQYSKYYSDSDVAPITLIMFEATGDISGIKMRDLDSPALVNNGLLKYIGAKNLDLKTRRDYNKP